MNKTFINVIPDEITQTLPNGIVEEMGATLQRDDTLPSPPVPKTAMVSRTMGMHPWAHGLGLVGLGDNYRFRRLSSEEIESMLVASPVQFGLMLKKAPVRSAFRDETTWKVIASKKTVAALVANNLKLLLPKYMGEILTCLEWGTSYFEIVARVGTAAELGVNGNGIGAGRIVAAVNKLNSCYPGSIAEIVRDEKTHEFKGFKQNTWHGDVTVGLDRVLLFNWQREFRLKKGKSYLRPIFAYWYWYEVVWRSFLNFLYRTGTPVSVCHYPHLAGFRLTDDEGNRVNAEARAMDIALTAASSSAIVLPSDYDPDSKQPYWRLEYLQENTKGDNFIKALEALQLQITRGLILADTVAMQQGILGGQAMSKQQRNITDLHTEWLLDEIVAHINEYLIPKIVAWNFGPQERATMETQGLDDYERERLFKLVQMLINSKHPEARYIDWLSILDKEGLPLLTPEEVRRKDAAQGPTLTPAQIEQMRAITRVANAQTRKT